MPFSEEPAVVELDGVGYRKRRALRNAWCRYAYRLKRFVLRAYAPAQSPEGSCTPLPYSAGAANFRSASTDGTK